MTARRILVTGVSRGLGLATAARLLERGATVLGLSRGGSAELDALRAAHGERLVHLAVDLGDVGSIKARVFGELVGGAPLHALVNNAAIAVDELVTNARVDDVAAMFAVNVLAPIELCNHAIRNMLVHGVEGSLVHVSSIAAHTGYKGLAAYGATKGALEALSRGLAREWGPRGIRSNCVAAGFVEAGMSERLPEADRERIRRRASLGRATSIDDVTRQIAALADGELTSTTGQTFVIDAGAI